MPIAGMPESFAKRCNHEVWLPIDFCGCEGKVAFRWKDMEEFMDFLVSGGEMTARAVLVMRGSGAMDVQGLVFLPKEKEQHE
jgi:hypothetical protein